MQRLRIEDWLAAQEGTAHHSRALAAGFTRYAIDTAVSAGRIRRLPRGWIAARGVRPEIERAIAEGGRLTCVSAAKAHGLWTPPHPDSALHLRVDPRSGRHDKRDLVLHWSVGPSPVGRYQLLDPVINVLEAVSRCLAFREALTVWESAVRRTELTPELLGRVPWRPESARRLAATASTLSDSGIETLVVDGLRPFGLRVRQQVIVDEYPVDLLVGERLVVQVDGAHHLEQRQRRRDIRGDARLALRGYTVLRFDYQQILFDWPHVERTILGAVTQGLHRRR
ncbi:MAG TPA: DUF559 domain-containing protein [Microbacterium sp.]|nr:DUF559 domain-containing protein [Microbacterium sp.]